MSEYKFETLQLHVGQEQADPVTDARAVPIYQTTSYVFHNSKHAADRFGLADAGNIYGRLTNSTQDMLEKRLAALEGGSAALALASGAAAITYTIEALAANGGHIVAQKTIYGGTFNLLLHTLQGIGAGFVPDVLNTKVYDEVFKASNQKAFETAKLLAKKEGISVGISSGAALYGAIELAKRPENKDKVIVALLPDSGDRYYSTALFTE